MVQEFGGPLDGPFRVTVDGVSFPRVTYLPPGYFDPAPAPQDYDPDGEIAAENGWLRAAEYDQEAQDQMAYEDAMGFT